MRCECLLRTFDTHIGALKMKMPRLFIIQGWALPNPCGPRHLSKDETSTGLVFLAEIGSPQA
jgi:hypothetical protein